MAAKAKPIRSRYGVHPAVFMVQKWATTLPEKTGRSLDEWLAVIARKGPKEKIACRDWLKSTWQLNTMTATWLAEQATGDADWGADPKVYLARAEEFVDAMFAGPKAPLRPTYEVLLETSLALGDDVKACPCRTIVPIYRAHVIAQIKPSTRTRIDFGLALGDMRPTGRLIDTGGFAKKDRITHRIEVSSPADVDDDLRRWLKVAYDLDGDARPKKDRRTRRD